MADEKAAKTEDVVADFTSDWRWMQFLKFWRENNVSVVVKRTETVWATYDKSIQLSDKQVSHVPISKHSRAELTVPFNNRGKCMCDKTFQWAWNRVEDLIQHCHGHYFVCILAPAEGLLKILTLVSQKSSQIGRKSWYSPYAIVSLVEESWECTWHPCGMRALSIRSSLRKVNNWLEVFSRQNLHSMDLKRFKLAISKPIDPWYRGEAEMDDEI